MRQLKITKQVTSRETISLDKYLQDISKLELLTPEEEVTLAKRIKKGDRDALERLVKANLRFVVSVSKQYQNQGLTLPDLINEGNLGLIKAAERFDETRGFKFISYAVWWIRQSILQALAEQARIVRLPLNKIGSINKINKVFSELEQKYQREPSSEEIASILKITPELVEDSLIASNQPISMDAPLRDDENANTFYDTILNNDLPSPDFNLIKNSLQKDIKRALSTLTERESNVIVYYFGLNEKRQHTLEEIGAEFNLTRERVRQIKEKALHKMQHQFRNKLLKTYLGQ